MVTIKFNSFGSFIYDFYNKSYGFIICHIKLRYTWYAIVFEKGIIKKIKMNQYKIN